MKTQKGLIIGYCQNCTAPMGMNDEIHLINEPDGSETWTCDNTQNRLLKGNELLKTMETERKTQKCNGLLPNGNPCESSDHKAQRTPTPTPTPWKVSQTGKFVVHSRPGTILTVCEASVEDAALIVRAVNAHKELVESMKAIQERLYKGFSYGPKMKDSADVCFNDALALATVTLRNLGEAIAKTEGKE